MPDPRSNYQRAARVAAATALGLPTAGLAYLRLKYGPTLADDVVKIYKGYKVMKRVQHAQENNFFIVDFFELHVKETPDRPFLLYGDDTYTYGDMDGEANKLARFVMRHGALSCKDSAAILMLNEPGFIVSWLAFSKLGVQTAFLNYNLKGRALLHCMKACKIKAIICGKDTWLLKELETIMPEIQDLGIKVWVLGKVTERPLPSGMTLVNTWNERSDPIPKSTRAGISIRDPSVYIFTSGTTGFPKAAKVSHYRSCAASFIMSSMGHLEGSDIFYVTLPLYHIFGFSMGLLTSIVTGCTVALSTFSPKIFWDEVRKYQANVILYIGEICRYLLAQPPCPNDGELKIKCAIGLGLRPDVWEDFQKRFNVGQIYEQYGATESPFMIVNTEDKVGSVGRFGGLMKAVLNIIEIVKCDIETAEPIRDANGKCIIAEPGETGLFVVKVDQRIHFDGYMADKKTNEKKLVRNVKKVGDVYYNSGDLMMVDKEGYLYFKDRLGDTFRWKGENVSTTEVAEIMGIFPAIMESNVYGVVVPGKEGKAGMAAVRLKKDVEFDPKSLYDHVTKALPLYACPKFLRITEEILTTTTFKHQKSNLAKEGFDVNIISDPLYFLDVEKKTYVPLDKDVMRRIVIGQARL
ncbi:very long-chain acyl-CoA synthetase-like [Acanthaster planci]|uniref:long-chain-fatty-acid--CoA ligase n=1 Tax=Acanthaster planci TaxID=133434 RepID=A0A8B8A0B5_ACAPL|nr:very long-chain acyl-CoA synthetase-like [Acanthaster planci]XP_022110797.1 very long-chain acyl-CoA synthetase-like [Acanthaster planci]